MAASGALTRGSGVPFLVAGLVLVGLAVTLSEYDRRHPLAHEAGTDSPTPEPKKVELPSLLATAKQPAADVLAGAEVVSHFQDLLSSTGEAVGGFSVVTGGAVVARELRGGFGAVLFLADEKGQTALVRATAGEPAKVIAAWPAHVTTLQVDGTAAFWAEGGRVYTMSARGGEVPVARVDFTQGVVTALAAVGDTLFVVVMPKDAPLSDGAVGAVAKVDTDGTVTLIAQDQVRPRDLVADGKDVFWVAGAPGTLSRAPADGSFVSKVGEAQGPLALDGDGVVVGGAGELRRLPRAGGAATTLAHDTVEALTASSGLVRYAAGQAVYEVSAGGEPTAVLKLTGPVRGVALAGTSLYVLEAGASSTLYAR